VAAVSESLTPPLRPEELDRLAQLSPEQRGAWMLDDCARHEEAWILRDEHGWVLVKLGNAPAGRSPYALPLWPRQEMAAMAARDAGDQPELLSLEDLIEEVLPEVSERGWQVVVCPAANGGWVLEAEDFSDRLSAAWQEMDEEEG
jgi:hypothetical protein